MANQLNTVTDTYKGQSIQCAQFVIDTPSSLFRCEPLDKNDDYAFQMIAKANGNKSITVFCGNKSHTFELTTSWAEYSYVFEDVIVNSSYLQFQFSDNGDYYLYHSKLEHGNKVTDWNEADNDVRSYAEQTANKLSWVVASGTSASDFTLTDRVAQLVAQYINLHGLVAFTALNNDIRKIIQGMTKINVLANYESISTAHDNMLYTYTNSGTGISESTTVDFRGASVTIPLGKVADYSKWNATKRAYLPEGDTVVYHGWINMGIYISIHMANVDVWYSTNRSNWYCLVYDVEDGEVLGASSVSTFDGNLLDNTIIYARSIVNKTEGVLTLKGSDGVGICGWDTTVNAFVEENLNTTEAGAVIKRWAKDGDTTYINGGLIAAKTILAGSINVDDLYALEATIAGWIIEQTNISKQDDTLKTESYTDKSWGWNSIVGIQKTSSTVTEQGYYKSTLSSDARFLADFVDSNDALISSAQYTGQGIYNAITQAYLLRLLSDGILVNKMQATNTFSESTYATDGYFTNLNAINIKAGTNDMWHGGNLVCGHKKVENVTAHTPSMVTISIPTSQIGTKPIVSLTKYTSNDDVWVSQIQVSGDNTVVYVQAYNGSSSARDVEFDYMVAKHS